MIKMFLFEQINLFLSLIVGWPLNLLLIWLILKKTNKLMRVWSWLLLQTSLIDLANLLVFFIVQPMFFTTGRDVNFYSDGPFGQSSEEIIHLLSALYLYFSELSKYAIAGQFFYRWMIICCERKFSIPLYAIANGIPILIAFLPAYGVILGTDFLESQQMPASCQKCPPNRTIMFAKTNGSFRTRLYPFIFIIANLTTYSIILATSIQIWRKSRQSMLSEQQHSREFSRQIGIVLLVQALMPFIFSMLPSIIIAFCSATGLDISPITFLFSLLNWPSVLTPLITILIVGQYRRYLAQFLCKKANTTKTTAIQIQIMPMNGTNGLVDSNGQKIISTINR